MKEIKMIEVDENLYKLELSNGIKIKIFYNIAEMTAIVNDMKDKNDALGRLFSKVVLTARFNTNLDWTDMTDNEIFDACAELGLIDNFIYEIDMFDRLDNIIKNDESVYKVVSEFLDVINSKLDGFDITKIQDGFSGLKDVVNSGRL